MDDSFENMQNEHMENPSQDNLNAEEASIEPNSDNITQQDQSQQTEILPQPQNTDNQIDDDQNSSENQVSSLFASPNTDNLDNEDQDSAFLFGGNNEMNNELEMTNEIDQNQDQNILQQSEDNLNSSNQIESTENNSLQSNQNTEFQSTDQNETSNLFGSQNDDALTDSSSLFGQIADNQDNGLQQNENEASNLFGSTNDNEITDNSSPFDQNNEISNQNDENETSNLFGYQNDDALNDSAMLFSQPTDLQDIHQDNDVLQNNDEASNLFGSPNDNEITDNSSPFTQSNEISNQNDDNETSNLFGSQNNDTSLTDSAMLFGSAELATTEMETFSNSADQNETQNLFGSSTGDESLTNSAELFGTKQDESKPNDLTSPDESSNDVSKLFANESQADEDAAALFTTTPTSTPFDEVTDQEPVVLKPVTSNTTNQTPYSAFPVSRSNNSLNQTNSQTIYNPAQFGGNQNASGLTQQQNHPSIFVPNQTNAPTSMYHSGSAPYLGATNSQPIFMPTNKPAATPLFMPSYQQPNVPGTSSIIAPPPPMTTKSQVLAKPPSSIPIQQQPISQPPHKAVYIPGVTNTQPQTTQQNRPQIYVPSSNVYTPGMNNQPEQKIAPPPTMHIPTQPAVNIPPAPTSSSMEFAVPKPTGFEPKPVYVPGFKPGDAQQTLPKQSSSPQFFTPTAVTDHSPSKAAPPPAANFMAPPPMPVTNHSSPAAPSNFAPPPNMPSFAQPTPMNSPSATSTFAAPPPMPGATYSSSITANTNFARPPSLPSFTQPPPAPIAQSPIAVPQQQSTFAAPPPIPSAVSMQKSSSSTFMPPPSITNFAAPPAIPSITESGSNQAQQASPFIPPPSMPAIQTPPGVPSTPNSDQSQKQSQPSSPFMAPPSMPAFNVPSTTESEPNQSTFRPPPSMPAFPTPPGVSTTETEANKSAFKPPPSMPAFNVPSSTQNEGNQTSFKPPPSMPAFQAPPAMPNFARSSQPSISQIPMGVDISSSMTPPKKIVRSQTTEDQFENMNNRSSSSIMIPPTVQSFTHSVSQPYDVNYSSLPFFSKKKPITAFGFGGLFVRVQPASSQSETKSKSSKPTNPSSGIVEICKINQVLNKLPVVDQLSSFNRGTSPAEIQTFINKRIQTSMNIDEQILWAAVHVRVHHGATINVGLFNQNSKIMGTPEYILLQLLSQKITKDGFGGTSINSPNYKNVQIDPQQVEQLQKIMIDNGEREGLDFSVKNKMWPFAFLIASSLTQSDQQRVVNEFLNTSLSPSPLKNILSTISGQHKDLGQESWEERLNTILRHFTPSASKSLMDMASYLETQKDGLAIAHLCLILASQQLTTPRGNFALIGTDWKHPTISSVQMSQLICNSITVDFYPIALYYTTALIDFGLLDFAQSNNTNLGNRFQRENSLEFLSVTNDFQKKLNPIMKSGKGGVVKNLFSVFDKALTNLVHGEDEDSLDQFLVQKLPDQITTKEIESDEMLTNSDVKSKQNSSGIQAPPSMPFNVPPAMPQQTPFHAPPAMPSSTPFNAPPAMPQQTPFNAPPEMSNMPAIPMPVGVSQSEIASSNATDSNQQSEINDDLMNSASGMNDFNNADNYGMQMTDSFDYDNSYKPKQQEPIQQETPKAEPPKHKPKPMVPEKPQLEHKAEEHKQSGGGGGWFKGIFSKLNPFNRSTTVDLSLHDEEMVWNGHRYVLKGHEDEEEEQHSVPPPPPMAASPPSAPPAAQGPPPAGGPAPPIGGAAPPPAAQGTRQGRTRASNRYVATF